MGKFKIESTRGEAPTRLLVHGDGGVGKSSLAAGAPHHVFVATESGLKNIDARAVQPYPQTWEDVLDALEELATLAEIKTVAIDSLDWLEPLCWDYVCRKAKKADIEAFGYGKGYLAALNEWRVLINKLTAIYASGKNVVLIAHSVRKTFKNPAGDDFERWTIKLHEKAAGLFKEWVDVVAFAEIEVATIETSVGSGRFKGLTTGKRVLRTVPSAAYDAKTRYAMPKSIPLDWRMFDHAVKEGGKGALVRLRAELDGKLAELANDDVTNGARSFLKERGETVPTLTEALQTVNEYLAEQRKAS